MEKIQTWLDGRFIVDNDSGCWLWTGSILGSGYAQRYVKGTTNLVHRQVYEAMIGPIPYGFQVDHVFDRGCRHKHCVNPLHLEAISHKENAQRYHSSKEFCRNGHKREDLYISSDGRKRCRQCRRDNHKRWVKKNAESANTV